MADAKDLEELHAGEMDASGFNLLGADLAAGEWPDRDFSLANLTEAILSASNLERTNLSSRHLLDTQFVAAKMMKCIISGIALTNCNFSLADLEGAKMDLARFEDCSFFKANLIGCNFTRSTIASGNNFADCSVDESTIWDDVTIDRSDARAPAFRFYQYERGKLVRRPDPLETDAPLARQKVDLLRALSALEGTVNRHPIQSDDIPSDAAPLIGHNGGPSSAPLMRTDFDELLSAITSLRTAIVQPILNKETVLESQNSFQRLAEAVACWLLDRTNVFVDEYLKNLGTSAGLVTIPLIVYYFELADKLGFALKAMEAFK